MIWHPSISIPLDGKRGRPRMQKDFFWRFLFGTLMLAFVTLACGVNEITDEPEPTVSGFVQAQVTHVVDGDTIRVLIDGAEYRVRYIGIDTPETKHPTHGVEPFGPELDLRFVRSRPPSRRRRW